MNRRLDEKSPPGWSGTTKAMKKHKDIDNPFALSWYMKNKGDKAHYKPEPGDTSKSKKKPEKKEKYKHEDRPKHKKFKEWLGERGVVLEQQPPPQQQGQQQAPQAQAPQQQGQQQQGQPNPEQAAQALYQQLGIQKGSQINAQQAQQIQQMWTQAGLPAESIPIVMTVK